MMMKATVFAGSLLMFGTFSVHAQPAPGWPETVDKLSEQRSQAETCVALLRDSSDPAAIRKGRIVYGSARAASDGAIAGFTVALVEGTTPGKLPALQAAIDRAGTGLKEVCADAAAAAPASGAKGVVEDLARSAIGPTIEAIKAAAGGLWAAHRQQEALEREMIEKQLEAAKWPEFGP